MTDVISLPPDMFFDPVLWDNQSLFLPVWLWIILILFVIGFIALVLMVIIWFIMRPVAGYGAVGDASTAKGSPTQVFSIWKNRSFVIEAMWYYGNMLTYGNPLNKMQMWFHNSEKATGVSAGKPMMITRDGFGGTVDFIAEMAMCEIPKLWNQKWGLNEDGSERKDEDDISFLITRFTDIHYRIKLLETEFPEGIPIPIYKPYDLSEVYRYTPQDEDSLKFGGVVVEDAKEWATEDEKEGPGFIDKFGLIIICGLVGLASIGIMWYILPLGR